MSTVTETKPAPPRAAKRQASVLFDAPGPKARMRHNILTLISAIVILAIIYVVVARFDKEGQLQGKLWKPFIEVSTWSDYILPGIGGTLKAALAGAVLALLFGVLFGLGRMSDHRWIRIPAGAVVEFFRAIPLLILIFFVFSGPPTIANALNREFPEVTAFTALVISLMLYNGSVLAEIFRAGINAVPRGQSEAAYAIGLRKSGVMRLILIPQATTAMMPAIVSQLVVLLKDSALGWIISYEDLLNTGYRQIPTQYGNLIPAAIVIALIYIAMNLALSYLATWLEKRSRRSRKSAAKPIDVSTVPGAGLTGEAPGMPSA
ncbi:amino acid ABC transporter permease [Actinoallomurus spadix]|uniref:Amino acid ABC transporter permease n=1 Tax=Actinoallomurus spadix TaxID=79912 RepID=A0ABN0XIW9_9ACTN|nr:amino acid ABC transporter permease [Actinoallomurus spadix]MCO5987545.1 amino acid ABC transporter permease [Actinoallomurus spadix]